MDHAAVRADGPRRPPLCARRLRRQGSDADPDPRRRGIREDRRPLAGQHQDAGRGRGGIRQPAFCAAGRADARAPGLRPGDLGRRRHVARRPAIDDGGEPRPVGARRDALPARPRTCIPAGMAAVRQIPYARSPRLLATLHDADGNVTVAGFHDGIVPPDPAILDAIDAAAFDTPAYFDEIGAPAARARCRAAASFWCANGCEPTLEFNGIFGGYSGPGTKTVIPSSAGAKITCRLVAGQDPANVAAAIERHLAGPPARPATRSTSSGMGRDRKPSRSILACRRWRSPRRCSARCWAQRRCGSPWARRSRSARSSRIISAPSTIFFSFSTSDEDYHAPNEFFRLENFSIGQIAWARLLERLGPRMR